MPSRHTIMLILLNFELNPLKIETQGLAIHDLKILPKHPIQY